MRFAFVMLALAHAATGQSDNPHWESSLFIRHCQNAGFMGYISAQDFSIKEMQKWRIPIDPAKNLLEHYHSMGMKPTVLHNRVIVNQRADTLYPLDPQTDEVLTTLRRMVSARENSERMNARAVQTKLSDFIGLLHEAGMLTEIQVAEQSRNVRFTYGFARTHSEADIVDYLEALIRVAEGTLVAKDGQFMLELNDASVWKRTLGAMGSGGFFIYTRPRGWGHERGLPGGFADE